MVLLGLHHLKPIAFRIFKIENSAVWSFMIDGGDVDTGFGQSLARHIKVLCLKTYFVADISNGVGRTNGGVETQRDASQRETRPVRGGVPYVST